MTNHVQQFSAADIRKSAVADYAAPPTLQAYEAFTQIVFDDLLVATVNCTWAPPPGTEVLLRNPWTDPKANWVGFKVAKIRWTTPQLTLVYVELR